MLCFLLWEFTTGLLNAIFKRERLACVLMFVDCWREKLSAPNFQIDASLFSLLNRTSMKIG